MGTPAAATVNVGTAESSSFDAIVIGAGVSGLYQLYQLRELGLRVRVFEAGAAVGGTWYWNRYPGARFDSESHTYGYSFSQELLDEWDWAERFAAQPDTERYLNYVADKFDLRRDIQFNSRVAAAQYREEARSWALTLEDGRRYSTRFLVTAIGILSAPTMPNIPGVGTFRGMSCHTHSWPEEGVDFTGKRVGIIGTGATAVQTIQEIAKTVGHLTVFQRTPNWCAPLNNGTISHAEMRDIRARYRDIFARCTETPGCYIHAPDPRSTHEVTAEEREAFWEKLYAEPGFGIWQGNFRDMLTDRAANAMASDFIARKIRQRVHDPVVAEKLIPKNHGFGTRRVPLETGYYEVYNLPNVELVDINDTPIERITPSGIKTTDRDHAFDIIIYATGFDAITGAFDRIDIRGTGGMRLRDVWQGGPQTYLGVLVEGFPNLLMAMGPHAGLGNYTRTAEYSVEWVTGLIRFATERGLTRIEASADGVAEWTDHVLALGQGQLMNEIGSWMTGVNRNVEGGAHGRLPPHMASVFTDCGFNVVSVAGNHAMDWGADPLLDTIDLLRAKGIQTIGAGRNLAEARQPAVIEAKGLRIAMLAYCSVLHEGYAAGPDTPGVAPMRASARFEPVDYQPGVPPRVITMPDEQDLTNLVADVRAAKEGADAVVLSLHWGVHFVPRLIADYQRTVARAAFDAGVDLILGHHAHVPKAIEVFGGKTCFYSLSNFIMSSSPKVTGGADEFRRNYGVPLDPEYPNMPYGVDGKRSLIAKTVFVPGGPIRASFLPVLIDRQLRPEILRAGDPRFDDTVHYMEWASEGFAHRFRADSDEIAISG